MGLAKIGSRLPLTCLRFPSRTSTKYARPSEYRSLPATDTANFQAKAQVANPKSVLALAIDQNLANASVDAGEGRDPGSRGGQEALQNVRGAGRATLATIFILHGFPQMCEDIHLFSGALLGGST